ncbi:MAG: rhamnulokinase [Lentisphaerales bacterium]|nr:MAG: rhamnulokinase [Lentisphaerales bacterium]
MKAKRLFAIDFGASGGKCFAGTFQGDAFSMQEIHRFSHEGVSFYVPDRTGEVTERTYWDDTLLYNNIVMGLQAFRRDISDNLDSIGIDTWGADGHFMSEDGELLGKVYCYRDHRLDNMIEVVKSRIDAKRVYEITGIHFHPFNLSNQLHWFVTNRGDSLGPGSFFLPIPSVFTFYLGGARQVDSAWASVTQLMDARTRQWSLEILDKLMIPFELMPRIVEPGAAIGELHEQLAATLGLNRASLMAVGSHDTASAFAAAPVSDPDEATIISSGTWSLIGKLVPEPITSMDAMHSGISNEGGIGNIRFLKNCMGTWIVQELRRGWRVEDGREMSWEEMDGPTRAAPPFCAMIDPDDRSFYNPASMSAAIDEFCSKTAQPKPGDRGSYLRTVYESLALKYRVVNDQICSACGKKSKVVNIVGGGSKNVQLNQFTADALGLPVLAGPEEATDVGNLMVQAMGLGIIDSMSGAQPIIKGAFAIRKFEPEDTAAWDKAYERFRKILTT